MVRSLAVVAAIVITLEPRALFAADEVNLYSARKEELIKPLLDKFSKVSGIEVNLG
jgi:iron(III) transport system substrate-binding protein